MGNYEVEAGLREQILGLHKEIESLKKWVSDLQAGTYVNCVYCGHRYGPDKDTSVAMADILKEHISVCPKHPMSQLIEDRKQLTRGFIAALNGDFTIPRKHLYDILKKHRGD